MEMHKSNMNEEIQSCQAPHDQAYKRLSSSGDSVCNTQGNTLTGVGSSHEWRIRVLYIVVGVLLAIIVAMTVIICLLSGQPGPQGDVDECASAPCHDGCVCTQGVNSYTCSCAAAMAVDCETDSSLVGFWPLNERDGFRDISGNGNHGNDHDVLWSDGPFLDDATQVVEMKGTRRSYVQIPNDGGLTVGQQMTWIAYVYAFTAGGTATSGSLFSWCANPGCATYPKHWSTHLWYFKDESDTHKGFFARPTHHNYLSRNTLIHSGTTEDVWQTVAFVMDSVTGIMSAWVNSVQVDLDISNSIPFNFDTNTDVRIGADAIDGRAIVFKMACVRLYDVALDMTNYDWDQESIHCRRPRLLGHWPFTEPYGFDDISGNRNHATSSDVAWMAAPGASSKMLNINGTLNASVEIANTDGRVSVWRSFTWIGQVYAVVASGSTHVFSWLPPPNSGYTDPHNTYITMNTDTGDVSAFAMKNGAIVQQITHSGIVTGEWNKVAVSMDGNAGSMKIWINGLNHISTGLGKFDFDTGNNIRIGNYPGDARNASVMIMCVQFYNSDMDMDSYVWEEHCLSRKDK